VIVVGIIFAAASLVWISLSTAESAKTLELEFQEDKRERFNGTDGKATPLNSGASVVTSGPDPVTAKGDDGLEMHDNGRSEGEGINDHDVKVSVADEQRRQQQMEFEEESQGSEYAAQKRQERLDAADAEKYWIFHFVMMLAAIYLAMLLTDWGSDPDPSGTSADTTVSSTEGKTSMWVKVVTQWLTNMMYIWTLVAPRLCPNRDWN